MVWVDAKPFVIANTINHMSQRKIVIACNHFLIREGLSSLLKRTGEIDFGGVVDNKEALLYVLDSAMADLVIVDFESMDFDGPKEIALIQTQYKDCRLLLLVNGLSHQDASALTSLGLKNIVSKSADEEEILHAIELAFKGKKFYSDAVLELLIEKSAKNPLREATNLTLSETEIVKLIVEGLTTKEIALQKHISFHTVMTHRKNIFRKLNVTNVSELMLYAIKAGWIDNIEYYI